jgi:hypothetical protein
MPARSSRRQDRCHIGDRLYAEVDRVEDDA